MKECIIGIAGCKNSGKDTVANMINYIFATGITRSNYADYVIRRKSINISHKDRIVHFADNMKDVMSIIFSIPRFAFDNRVKKDSEYWVVVPMELAKSSIVVPWKPFIYSIGLSWDCVQSALQCTTL